MNRFDALHTAFKHAAQTMRSRWSLTLLAALMLTIGLATVIFALTLINTFVLKSLPFANPQTLFASGQMLPDFDRPGPVVAEDFVLISQRLKEAQPSGVEVAGYFRATMVLASEQQAGLDIASERFDGTVITHQVMSMLGVAPIIGRLMDESALQSNAIAISENVWRARYQRDPSIIGRAVKLNGEPAVIAAVMPDHYGFPVRSELWQVRRVDTQDPRDQQQAWDIVIRAEPQRLDAVRAMLTRSNTEILARQPELERQTQWVAVPLFDYFQEPDNNRSYFAMLIATVMLLLVVCANVSNLLMASFLKRQSQLAIRMTLGASRMQLIMEIIALGFLLALAALLVAWPIATWAVEAAVTSFGAATGAGAPHWLSFAIDLPMIVMVSAATILAALSASLMPAVKLSRPNLLARRESRSEIASFGWLGQFLIAFQIAIAAVLLIGTGALQHVVSGFSNFDLGVHANDTLSARVYLDEKHYPNPAARLKYYADLKQALMQNPQVKAAGVSSLMPGWWGDGMTVKISAEAEAFPVDSGVVDDQFAQVFESKLLAGRWFSASEGTQFTAREQSSETQVAVDQVAVAQVAVAMESAAPEAVVPESVIIDEVFAERLTPNSSNSAAEAIGKQVMIDINNQTWATVVGVIEKLAIEDPDDVLFPVLLQPMGNHNVPYNFIVAKVNGDPAAFKPQLQRVAQSIDPDVPLYWLRSFQETRTAANFGNEMLQTIFSVFAISALVLASLGLFGLVSFLLGQRIREIALRRALGAGNGDIIFGLSKQNFVQILLGLLIGGLLAKPFVDLLIDTAVSKAELPWWLWPASLSGLALVSLLAMVIPLRNALRIQPQEALRE